MKPFVMLLFLLLIISASLSTRVWSQQSDLQSDDGSEQQAANQEKKLAESKQTKTVLGMNVSGNKELPNILYIVPWKQESHLDIDFKLNRLVNEIYAPLEPSVFSKKIKYYTALTTSTPLVVEDGNEE